MNIPKKIIQTYPTEKLDIRFEHAVQTLQAKNPGWEYERFDDAQVAAFIKDKQPEQTFKLFNRIAPEYGVARSDFFRYAYLYEYGGVYLDIKSGCNHPLDRTIREDDNFLLSRWDKPTWGYHPDLEPYGSYQQWFIACRPRHPFLANVMARVLRQLMLYRPDVDGVGPEGVYATTGPVIFTKAIEEVKPSLHSSQYREIVTAKEGLKYTMLGEKGHRSAFAQHYSTLSSPICI